MSIYKRKSNIKHCTYIYTNATSIALLLYMLVTHLLTLHLTDKIEQWTIQWNNHFVFCSRSIFHQWHRDEQAERQQLLQKIESSSKIESRDSCIFSRLELTRQYGRRRQRNNSTSGLVRSFEFLVRCHDDRNILLSILFV